MEDVDFDEEAVEGAEEQTWETEEEDEGVEDGMEAQDDSEVTFSEHSASIFCTSLDPTTNTLAVTGGEDDKAFVWQLSDGECPFECSDDLANEMEDVDFDEEAVEGAEEQAWETEEEDEGVEDGMEAQDDSEVTFSEHSASFFCVSLDPTTNTLAVTGGEDDKAFVWQLSDGERLFECSGHPQPGAYPGGYPQPAPYPGGYPQPGGYPGGYPQPGGYPHPGVPPMSTVPMNLGDSYGSGGSGEEDGLRAGTWDEKSVRHTFIRKVYTIISVQLLVTVGIIAVFTFVSPVRTFVQRNIAVYYCSYAVFIITYLVLAWCQDSRRRFPWNLILLSIFTLAMAFMTGTIASKHDGRAVLIAMVITAIVAIMVTVFCFQTKVDFTSCTGLFCVLGIVVMVTGIITAIVLSFTYVLWLHMLYAAIGAIVFTLFLAYNTQLVLRNRKNAISPEEYVYGAMEIYMFYIYFVQILTRPYGEECSFMSPNPNPPREEQKASGLVLAPL